jgi:hypothetical protein
VISPLKPTETSHRFSISIVLVASGGGGDDNVVSDTSRSMHLCTCVYMCTHGGSNVMVVVNDGHGSDSNLRFLGPSRRRCRTLRPQSC